MLPTLAVGAFRPPIENRAGYGARNWVDCDLQPRKVHASKINSHPSRAQTDAVGLQSVLLRGGVPEIRRLVERERRASSRLASDGATVGRTIVRAHPRCRPPKAS